MCGSQSIMNTGKNKFGASARKTSHVGGRTTIRAIILLAATHYFQHIKN